MNGENRKRCTLLVVDDHRDTVNLLARVFRMQGYSVLTAESVSEAIHIARSARPDAALLDIHLPDGDGCDLLRTLRELVGPLRAIAVTGLAMPRDLQRIQAAGFDGHVLKPVHLNELNAALAKICCDGYEKATGR